MKLKTIMVLLVLIMIPLVIATVTYSLNSPDNHFRTSSTTVTFNWTPNSTYPTTVFPSYLYVTEFANESNFLLNKTVLYCTNQTSCNATVTGFNTGYYQWKVVTGENTSAPSILGVNSYPFNTSDRAAHITTANSYPYNTSDRNAIIEFNLTGPFNSTPGNWTVNMWYTNFTAIEQCNVTLSVNNSLSAANVTASFNTACNMSTYYNSSSTIFLTTRNSGNGSWIYLYPGNATDMLGLNTFTNYTGTENNTINLRYFNRTASSACNVSLNKGSSVNATDIITNFNSAGCNLTSYNTSTQTTFSTFGTGINDWIYPDSGSALGILGLTPLFNYTGSANDTLSLSYSINGTAAICTANFTKHNALNASTVVSNITSACTGLIVTNTSVISINGTGYGNPEYITITGGNASALLGFFDSNTYTGWQTNITSDSRYFEIYDISPAGNYTYFRWKNDSGFEAMNLNKDTGDLTALGYIRSNNWTNISILQSQITDLSAGSAFDQELNTTSNVTFNRINTTFINMTGGNITDVDNIVPSNGNLTLISQTGGIVCFNPTCTHYMNETCRVLPSGGTICDSP